MSGLAFAAYIVAVIAGVAAVRRSPPTDLRRALDRRK